jgi:hypothetical protein
LVRLRTFAPAHCTDNDVYDVFDPIAVLKPSAILS